MHAWMLWIVVGTGRMKDALWMKEKQGTVSCDYKYSFYWDMERIIAIVVIIAPHGNVQVMVT